MGLGDIVKVVVTGDSEGAKRALKSAQKEASNTGHSFSSMAKVGALGFAGLAAGAVEFGKAAVKAAEDEQTSHVRLLTALKNNHEAWLANKDAIDAVDKSSEKFGYTIADTESALAQGETATGSMKKTLDELSIAQNLAAMTGEDLSTAMTATEKAGEGNLKPLKAMGIDLPIVASSAEKTKVAFEAWGKAQQHVKDVQDAMHSKTTQAALADDAAVQRAKQNLIDAEQRYATAKHHTVSQLQAITRAQGAVTAAESKAAKDSKGNSDTIKGALEKDQVAQQHYNDLANSGVTATEALRKKVANGATNAAKTFRGHTAALHAEWTDFEAKIGNKIIPVIDDLMTALSSDKAMHDAAAGWYEIEVIMTGVANAAIHAYNALVHIDNAGKRVGNFMSSISGGHLGTKSKTDSTLPTIAQPQMPDLANPTVQPTQALKDYENGTTPTNAHGLGFDPTKSHGPPIIHIHAHAQPTPAMIKTWTDAYNKRNGTKAPNAKYTATSP